MTAKLLRYPAEIIVLVCLLFTIMHRPVDDAWDRPIESDGKGYYAYLPAVFIYDDLGFGFVDEYEKTYYPHGHSYVNFLNPTEDGGKVNQFFPGVALLWLPFFFIAHVLSLIFGFQPDGYSVIYQQAIMAASLFFLWLGCRFTHRIVLRFIPSAAASVLILLAVVFATPLAFYALYFPSFTHVYSFALIAAFIHFCYRFFEERKIKLIALAVLTLALICIVRPINATVILLVPFIAGSFPALKQATLEIFRDKRAIAISLLITAAVFSIPLLLWKGQTGHYLVYSYGIHTFNFTDPQLFNSLFSYRKGLFVYTPIAFIALLGLIPMARRDRFRFFWMALFLFMLAYLLSSWSWWWYGTTFGQRSYIDHFAVLGILLCFAYKMMKTANAKALFFSIIALAGGLNIFQNYQYVHGILPGDEVTKEVYWSIFLDVRKEAKAEVDETEYIPVATAAEDMETADHPSISTEHAFSGVRSSRISPDVQFSVNAIEEIEFSSGDTNMIIKVSAMVFTQEDGTGNSFVVSVQSAGELAAYRALELKEYTNRNDWVKVEQTIRMPLVKDGKAVIKAYCWNHDGGTVLFADDITITLFQPK